MDGSIDLAGLTKGFGQEGSYARNLLELLYTKIKMAKSERTSQTNRVKR